MDDMSPIPPDPDGRARVPNSDRLFRLLRVTREEREPWIHPLMAEFNAQRRARKVTVKELARRSGYSIHTINHYSRGCGRPSAQMLADLANAIGLELRLVPVERGE